MRVRLDLASNLHRILLLTWVIPFLVFVVASNVLASNTNRTMVDAQGGERPEPTPKEEGIGLPHTRHKGATTRYGAIQGSL